MLGTTDGLARGPYVGIDPASVITTMVVLQGRGDQPWVMKRVGVRGTTMSQARFGAFASMVRGVLRALDALPRPEMVAIEGYNLGGRTPGHSALAELGALLRIGVLTQRWRVMEAPPATVRKFATGDGNCSLGAMMRALEARYCQTSPRGGLGAYATAYALAQMARCACCPEGYEEWQVAALAKTQTLTFGP